MTVCLSKEGCERNGITVGEALLLLAVSNDIDLKAAEKILINKGYITANLDKSKQSNWRVTNEGTAIIEATIVDSDKNIASDENLLPLATALKELFPKGKKPSTNYYWAEGIPLIIRRLKLFFKKYGNNYTANQIIEATRKYVDSFNGDYTYMRLLKYFILKEKIGASGDVEGDSQLITFIENADQEDLMDNSWTSELK